VADPITYSTLPKQQFDVVVRQGSTFGPFTHRLKNPDGTPVDLTGCTARGQVRKTPTAAAVVATLDCAIPAPLEGYYTFGLSDEATDAIPAGDRITDPASQYVWDVELVAADGSVRCTLYGKWRQAAGVTR
jgi:hypothetical protein